MKYFSSTKNAVGQAMRLFMTRQQDALTACYAKDQMVHFRAVNLAQTLGASGLLIAAVMMALVFAEAGISDTASSAVVLPSLTLVLLIIVGCYYLVLKNRFELSRFLFMGIAFGATIGSVCLTGGFFGSPVLPVLIIPMIVAFCIYGGRTSIMIMLVAPIVLSLFALSGQIAGIDYPDISYQSLAVSDDVIVTAVTYGLIMLTLANLDKANIKFFESAQNLIQEKQVLAHTDFLTDLPNRRHFLNVLNQKKNNNFNNKSVVMNVVIDVNNFKDINDRHGHLTGDIVLRDIAASLRSLQSSSIMVARLGGDEFGLLGLFDTRKDAEKLLENCFNILPRTAKTDRGAIHISCSVGAYIARIADFDFNHSAQFADYALYQAKLSGGLHIFTPENRASIDAEKDVLETVKKCIEQEEIHSSYQLIQSLNERPPIVEVLLRIKDNNGTLLSPVVCLDATERLRLITEFTHIQLNSSILDVMAVSDQLRLAFNLSPAQLRDPLLVHTVKTIISETGFSPDRLILEISELTTLSSRLIDILKQLQKLGIKLAIDDFGAGHTGFQIFNHLDVDIIKADSSLLRVGQENEHEQFILAQICDFCQQFDIESVCEGIESKNIIPDLTLYGFDYFQGYALSRPDNLIVQLHNLKANRFMGAVQSRLEVAS